MKHSATTLLTIVGITFCVAFSSANAGIEGKEVLSKTILEEVPPESPWEIRIEPYGWLTSMKGTSGVNGFNSEVDLPFFNTVLDNLDMAAALQLEIRYGRWGVLADGFYAELSGSGSTASPLYSSVALGVKQVLGELALAYRVVEGPGGFVDLYAGVRYNYLSLDLQGVVDNAGVEDRSRQASEAVSDAVIDVASDVVAASVDEYRAAAASARQGIADAVQAEILEEGGVEALADLELQLDRIAELVPDPSTRRSVTRILTGLSRERSALEIAVAELEIARMKQSAGESVGNAIAEAEKQVEQAEDDLADAIEKGLKKRLPRTVSGDKNWVDPIIGFRAQWNITDKLFLAGDGNIGGFGAASEFVWEAQATVGYSFTKNVFAELGYRYLHTEYSDSGFVYDMDQFGMFMGLGLKF